MSARRGGASRNSRRPLDHKAESVDFQGRSYVPLVVLPQRVPTTTAPQPPESLSFFRYRQPQSLPWRPSAARNTGHRASSTARPTPPPYTSFATASMAALPARLRHPVIPQAFDDVARQNDHCSKHQQEWLHGNDRRRTRSEVPDGISLAETVRTSPASDRSAWQKD